MAISLTIPTATSQRIVQVRVLDENRQLINQHRAITGKSKVSYTHIIGWAILRALDEFRQINDAYTEQDGNRSGSCASRSTSDSPWMSKGKTDHLR